MGRDEDAGLKASTLQVGSERETVEAEIKRLVHALPCEVGLDKPLVDSAGFPRADVDVAAVRALRQKITMLTSDHKALTRQLDSLLQELHAQARQAQLAEQPPGEQRHQPVLGRSAVGTNLGTTPQGVAARPFAVVESVSKCSPALAGGMQPQDRIVSFGAVTAAVPSPLLSIDKLLQVVVLRRGTIVELDIVPTQWTGTGLLGCQLRPLSVKII